MATSMDTYYPFATGAGSNVTEAQWREMARQWLADGVVDGEGSELAVVQSVAPAMTVSVGTGQVRIRGHVGIQAAAATLAITANASGSTRIDRVVARADFVNDRVEFDVLVGTPGAGVAPALTQNAAVWEVTLATVSVASGAVSILTANITDGRTIIIGGGQPTEVDVFPVYTTAARDAILTWANGDAIYNSTLGYPQVRIAGTWKRIAVEAGTTIRVAWTYTLPGSIAVPSGVSDDAFLPYAPIVVPTGQTVTLVGYRWTLVNGTSFTFSMTHGTGATLATTTVLVSGVVAASASVKGSGTFGVAKACADGDAWWPSVTAVSGSPKGGSLAVVADIAV